MMPNKKSVLKFPCPACGFLVFVDSGKFEICPVCQWEDDPLQAEDPELAGGANKSSLRAWQKILLKKLPPRVKTFKTFQRPPRWKP